MPSITCLKYIHHGQNYGKLNRVCPVTQIVASMLEEPSLILLYQIMALFIATILLTSVA